MPNRIIAQIAIFYNIDFTTYSTTREIPCGVWIDGKTIYKKTVDFGNAPDATTKSVNHNISNISKIVKLEGIGVNSVSGNYTPLPYVPASAGSMMDFSVDTTTIKMTAVDDRSSWSFYVTIYYTKTS